MMIVSTDNIPGREIEALGMVKGSTSAIMQSAAEIMVYGTAVKVK